MVFVKGMKPTKGFTGKKHSEHSKAMMSEGRKTGWALKKLSRLSPDQKVEMKFKITHPDPEVEKQAAHSIAKLMEDLAHALGDKDAKVRVEEIT